MSALAALMAEHGVTVAAVFVPFSQSRDAGKKELTLNWRVTLQAKGRAVISCEYGAGVAHCPAYKLSVKEAGGLNSIMRHEMLKHECETGREYRRFGNPGAPILPDSVRVIGCLMMDAAAVNESSFSDWCENFGFDSDSIKARKIYDECLAHGLAIRAALGGPVFESFYEAACNE